MPPQPLRAGRIPATLVDRSNSESESEAARCRHGPGTRII